MRIAVARETDPVENRVAATPDTVKKMKGLGAEVAVEPGAGTKSEFQTPNSSLRAQPSSTVRLTVPMWCSRYAVQPLPS